MNNKSVLKSLFSPQKIAHFLVEKNAILRWSILNRCILMLVLGSLIHVFWIIWKIYILSAPTAWAWVNIDVVQLQLVVNCAFLSLFICLIYPCYRWSDQPWVQKIMPYLSVGVLVISLCRDSYLVGVLSPATMVCYVSLVTVGLVLFNRRIVYGALIPATLFLIGVGILGFFEYIPYAPLFNFRGLAPFQSGFWILSMLFFIVPMLFTCLVLFEILLSQWRYRESLIRRLSQLDPLTNLSNRRSINKCLENFHLTQETSYAVILIDLDHFKLINDRFGHNKGDEALILVGHALTEHVRESDVVGRFGGEEFILLLKHTHQQHALQIAERCLSTIQNIQLFSEDAESIKITASFGITMSNEALRPQQLLNQADQALYAAKATGRNCIRCYTDLENANSIAS